MSYLDDLPKRDRNRRIQEQSDTAFQTAISECGEFVIQSEDKYDYGTDYLIEARRRRSHDKCKSARPTERDRA